MPTKQKKGEPGASGKIGPESAGRPNSKGQRAGEAVTTKVQKNAQTGQDRGGMGDMKSSKKNK